MNEKLFDGTSIETKTKIVEYLERAEYHVARQTHQLIFGYCGEMFSTERFKTSLRM